jgi:hypothetical protein
MRRIPPAGHLACCIAFLALLCDACVRSPEPPSAADVPDRECVERCQATDDICTNNVRGSHGLKAESVGGLIPAVIDAGAAYRGNRRCADALGRCYESCGRED